MEKEQFSISIQLIPSRKSRSVEDMLESCEQNNGQGTMAHGCSSRQHLAKTASYGTGSSLLASPVAMLVGLEQRGLRCGEVGVAGGSVGSLDIIRASSPGREGCGSLHGSLELIQVS
jgi:hypothetical protein